MSSSKESEVQCSSCGTTNDWFAEVCTSCGASLAGTSLQNTMGQRDKVETVPEADSQTSCPNCRAMNGRDDRFCTDCGTSLVEAALPDRGAGMYQGDAGPQPDERKPCPNCRTINGRDDRFCISCGTSLIGAALQDSGAGRNQGDASPQPDRQKPCPNCRTMNGMDVRFCGSCGTSLVEAVLQDSGTMIDPRIGARPPNNYLTWAILSTICCCVITGIIAIIYSAQVNGKWESGDQIGAEHASSRAKMWVLIGIAIEAVVVLGYVIYIVSVGAEALNNFNEWSEFLEGA